MKNNRLDHATVFARKCYSNGPGYYYQQLRLNPTAPYNQRYAHSWVGPFETSSEASENRRVMSGTLVSSLSNPAYFKQRPSSYRSAY